MRIKVLTFVQQQPLDKANLGTPPAEVNLTPEENGLQAANGRPSAPVRLFSFEEPEPMPAGMPALWRRGTCTGCRRQPAMEGSLCGTCAKVRQDWLDDEADRWH
ncbi:MAG: hypothetical protein V3U35_00770 [Candidatus Neomarinimicrobiota bacterium]